MEERCCDYQEMNNERRHERQAMAVSAWKNIKWLVKLIVKEVDFEFLQVLS